MLRECAHPACRTWTMGELCIAHEQPVTRVFQHGRVYSRRIENAEGGGRSLVSSRR